MVGGWMMGVGLRVVGELAGGVREGGDPAGRQVHPADGSGRAIDENQLVPIRGHQHLVCDFLSDVRLSWDEDQCSQVVEDHFRLVDHINY